MACLFWYLNVDHDHAQAILVWPLKLTCFLLYRVYFPQAWEATEDREQSPDGVRRVWGAAQSAGKPASVGESAMASLRAGCVVFILVGGQGFKHRHLWKGPSCSPWSLSLIKPHSNPSQPPSSLIKSLSSNCTLRAHSIPVMSPDKQTVEFLIENLIAAHYH